MGETLLQLGRLKLYIIPKTIWGKEDSVCDLSLETVAEFLNGATGLSPQTTINVAHLHKLIYEGLREHSSSNERADVSDEMWKHKLVTALRDRLGASLVRTTGHVGNDLLKSDTVGVEGFSLRVNRRDRTGEVALLSITRGAFVIFPSRHKLNRCLPKLRDEVEAYMCLVQSFGCDVEGSGENAAPRIPFNRDCDKLLGKADELARCLQALA